MYDLNDIEHRVDNNRENFVRSLDQLSSLVSRRNVTRQASDLAQDYGGEIGRQTWETAKANPAAFVLVGAGLALMLSGAEGRATERRSDEGTKRTAAVPPEEAMIGFDERLAAATQHHKQERSDMTGSNTSRATQMRAALNRGLDQLPGPARKRVLQARTKALGAQEKLEHRARSAARRSQTFHHDQPLAVGAIALGIGALIGALLPSTHQEDKLMGAERDALMAKAQDTLREEMDRLGTAANDALEQAADPDRG